MMEHHIKLQGRPRCVESIIPSPFSNEAVITASFEFKGVETKPIIFAKSFGAESTRVRLRFPRNTPPGSYKGFIQMGKKAIETIVEIYPEPFLQLIPTELYFFDFPHQPRAVSLSVVNNGNYNYEINTTYAVGLFAHGQIENALGAAYRATENAGKERVAILFDKLAEAHAGLLKIQVESGAGMLSPNESRTLQAQLRFPANLRSGNKYYGVLLMQNAQCGISVDLPPHKTAKKEKNNETIS